MKLIDFVKALAAKAGVPAEEVEKLTLPEGDVPETIATPVQTKLYDLEAAKIHPEVASFHQARTLDPIDSRLKELAKSYNIEDAELLEIFAGNSKTVQRIEKVLALTKTKAAAATPGSQTAKELADKVNTLTNELAKVQAESEAKVQAIVAQKEAELQAKNNEFQREFYLTKHLAGQQLVVGTNVALLALKEKLREKGAILVMDPQTGLPSLKQAANPDLNFLDGTTPVGNVDEYVSKILAAEKLLVVNPQGNNPGNPQSGNPAPTPLPGNNPAPTPGNLNLEARERLRQDRIEKASAE